MENSPTDRIAYPILILINSLFAGPVAGFVYFLYTPNIFYPGRQAEKKRKELMELLSEKLK